MKKKDLTMLIITLAIFAVIGTLVYSQILSKKQATGGAVTTVEVVDPISSDFSQEAVTDLSDPSKAINFQPNIDLSNLGNGQPFGPMH